jgi:hypothetical protein
MQRIKINKYKERGKKEEKKKKIETKRVKKKPLMRLLTGFSLASKT